ncbi:hypothetical protein APUTEX25_004635, partial [Auxenochlorella protothecoides]
AARPSLQQIRAAAELSWQELDEHMHRAGASRQGSPAGPATPRPSVEETADGSVRVILHIPAGLSVPGCLGALRAALAAGPRAPGGLRVTESSSWGAEGGTTLLQRSSDALGTLSVRVFRPAASDRPARVEIAGAFQAADLALLQAAARGACGLPGGARPWADELGAVLGLGRGLGSVFDLGPLGPMMQHMQEFMREFQALEGEEAVYPIAPSALTTGAAAAASRPPPRGGCGEGADGARRHRHPPGPPGSVDWGVLAGYEAQKRQMEDTLLLSLLHPEVHAGIAARTRAAPGPLRPRAVLFEGPPGTGKTTSARILATQAGVPLVYIPLESIASKWYGEAEARLGRLLAACEALPSGCIVFLDEVDSLATARGESMHEATRRTLGVLLRHMDGFDANKRTVVIAATNRKSDLDPALLSRFTTSVYFGLPTEDDRRDEGLGGGVLGLRFDHRAHILEQYAKHLTPEELAELAGGTPGLAGRDLRDVCEQAERRWASKDVAPSALPAYMLNAEERRASSTDSTSTAHGAAAVHSGVSTSFPLQKALVGPLRQVSLDLLTAAALAHDTDTPPERHSIFQDVLEQLSGRQEGSVSRTTSGLVPLPSLHFLEGLLDDMEMNSSHPNEPPLYLPLDSFDLVDRSCSGEQPAIGSPPDQPHHGLPSPRAHPRPLIRQPYVTYSTPPRAAPPTCEPPAAGTTPGGRWRARRQGPSRLRTGASAERAGRRAAPPPDDEEDEEEDLEAPEMVLLTSKSGRVRRVASFVGGKRAREALQAVSPAKAPAALRALPGSESELSVGGESGEEADLGSGRLGRRGRGAKAQRTTCLNCGCHSTPQWRCGPLGPRTLCNACGVRFKKGLPLNCWPLRDGMVLPPGATLPPGLEVPEGMRIYSHAQAGCLD